MNRNRTLAIVAALALTPLIVRAQATSPVAHANATAEAFRHYAVGVGVSPLGINLLAATSLTRTLDLRGTGNVFTYSIKNLTTNGIDINADLNLASAGVAVDYYPWGHGLRLSPGVLFYNGNQVSGTSAVAAGESFDLNGTTYYSSRTDPVNGKATVNLHTQSPAFTITAGWGSIVSRKSRRLTFPFEVGVALAGAPAMQMNLTGTACYDAAQTICTKVATFARSSRISRCSYRNTTRTWTAEDLPNSSGGDCVQLLATTCHLRWGQLSLRRQLQWADCACG